MKMKKILKWIAVVFAVLFLIGIIAAIFETDEQKAARELDTKNKEAVAEQVKAEKQAAREREKLKGKRKKRRKKLPKRGSATPLMWC